MLYHVELPAQEKPMKKLTLLLTLNH